MKAVQEEDNDNETVDSVRDPVIEPNHPPRKILTKNRLINSIDKSLDENLYDFHDFGLVDDASKEEVLVSYLGPKSDKNTKKIYWTNKKPVTVSRAH